MRSAVEDGVQWTKALIPGKHVQLIDTGKDDGKETETARDIVGTILDIVQRPIRMSPSR
jgi:hypothetical protein